MHNMYDYLKQHNTRMPNKKEWFLELGYDCTEYDIVFEKILITMSKCSCNYAT